MISKKKYSKEYKDVRAMFWDGKDNNDKTPVAGRGFFFYRILPFPVMMYL